MPMFDDATLAQFWSKIDRGGPDDCWPWRGSINEWGHGTYHAPRDTSPTILAHRIVYILSGGDPTGLCVCHSCDNPPCCNPAHLWLGTNQENKTDSVNKGRHVPPPIGVGERNAAAKLTDAQTTEIRSLLDFGVTGKEMGITYLNTLGHGSAES